MNTPTFKEQFDKITEAYIKDEIHPYNSDFCFCGTLAPCSNIDDEIWDTTFYSTTEFSKMEYALLNTIREETLGGDDIYYGDFSLNRTEVKQHFNYENALFNGMCAALEVLKDIHKSRGENVEEEFEFKKRQLQSV